MGGRGREEREEVEREREREREREEKVAICPPRMWLSAFHKCGNLSSTNVATPQTARGSTK